MRPSNDRELAIACTIDKIAIEGKINLTAIDEAVAALGFGVVHPSDDEMVAGANGRCKRMSPPRPLAPCRISETQDKNTWEGCDRRRSL